MDQMQAMSPAMGQMPTEEQEPEGTTVCITASPDGSFTVGDHEAYMSQQSGTMPDEIPGEVPEANENPGMTQAGSLDEALEIARGMLQGGPNQAAMDGYNSGKPSMISKPKVSAVFGE